MPLTVYTPFPVGGTSVSPADLSEVFLKSYTVASGVSSITISDALFKLSTYKSIHVRFNNLTTSGATSTYINGGAFRNDLVVSGGAYTSSVEGISSTTATGWTTSSGTPTTVANIPSFTQLSPSGMDFSQGIQQMDIYLTRTGLTCEFHAPSSSNSRRVRSTSVYPGTVPLAVSSSDYFGAIIGMNGGTFTGGTVSVFGVQ